MRKDNGRSEVLLAALNHVQEECATLRAENAALRAEKAGRETETSGLREQLRALAVELAESGKSHEQEIREYRLRAEEAEKKAEEYRLRAEDSKRESETWRTKAEEEQRRASLLEDRLSEVRSMLPLDRETCLETILDQSRTIDSLLSRVANSEASAGHARSRRFARSSEQGRLLNNRETESDKRADEKDLFDGTQESLADTQGDQAGAQEDQAPESEPAKPKRAGRKTRPMETEENGCLETVVHKLGDYFTLPEGARFKKRNGETEIHYYEYLEYFPARVIRHIYETASYEDSTGTISNTLPPERRMNPVQGCPYDAGLTSYMLGEKYAYFSPKNRVRLKFHDMGLDVPKSTLGRYFSNVEGVLVDSLREAFKRLVLDCDYLIIDETCELVRVTDPGTNEVRYKKCYLWGLLNPANNMVLYVYEHGSRSRDVLMELLDSFKGTFTSDAYGAYKIFDGDGIPGVDHTLCWVHARRCLVDGMAVARRECLELIGDIATLFAFEGIFKNLSARERAIKRKEHSLPVVNRIFNKVREYAGQCKLMSYDLMRKAVNYMLNGEKQLRKFITNGKAEISSNAIERAFKPIKLDLKACQNIGSESEAGRAAFMHSLVQSCRQNKKPPLKYLTALIESIKKPLDESAIRALMPDQWQPNC